MQQSEKIMWLYLLKYGSAYNNWDYYCGFKFAPIKDKRMRQSIREYGIDWDLSSTVQDDYESTFQGSFIENTNTAVLKGKLVSNGKTYSVGMIKDEFVTLIDIVLEMIDLNINSEIEESLKNI